MAKKKKRKEKEKKGFDHTEELIGIIFIVLAILSIVPKPFGFVGELTASFATKGARDNVLSFNLNSIMPRLSPLAIGAVKTALFKR